MAVWVRQREVAVSLRCWPTLPVAMSLGVIAAIAVSLIERSDQPNDYGLRIVGIVTVLCIGAWRAPWKSLSINLVTKRLRWQRVSLLGIRTLDAAVQDVTRISLSAHPCFHYWSRYQIQLSVLDGTWSLPLGWSWRETSETRFVETIQPWIADLRRTAPAIQVEIPRVERSSPRFQFSLRRLILSFCVVAAAIAAVNAVPWPHWIVRTPFLVMASTIAIGGVFLYHPGSGITERFLLTPIAMYFPMLWIFADKGPWESTSLLVADALIYPACWTLFIPPMGELPEGRPWLASVGLTLEWAVSLAFARYGWKCTLPWTVLIAATSIFGSVVLRAFSLE